jgi:hypothetical protein
MRADKIVVIPAKAGISNYRYDAPAISRPSPG